MSERRTSSRRNVLKATAGLSSTVAVAGCFASSDDDLPGPLLDPGSQILFEAYHEHWLGILPDEIDEEENPTIVLEAGEEYEIGWIQGDGGVHNIQIWDEDETVVDGLATDLVVNPGTNGDWLTITATEEMSYYRCDPHRHMQGEIHVV